jgi:phage portal protein BeeE
VVCATFHVPPFKVGVGTQPTYQNAEILNQIYYSDCLQSHIEQLELCMDQALGLRTKVASGKTLGVELDLDGLLRMDTASQITSLKEAVGGSIMAINEARQKLDLKPKIGGESILSQQQYYSIEALAERDKNGLLPWAKPAEVPALPAPEAQKALPPSSAERMTKLAQLIEINAATLRLAA